ncbi:M23 family metallopeptidase [Microbacter margulisiae]|uniref:Murein DD-endopeptidase MepM/ murein hydrolase activator NlpD n=1 Tax=Microbacter margulisiae TaxID=1350067 RepID=A0A7W5DUI8_9PORP|nr:M23 family metallopeptidase [Microbacter margulisiae]MBB3188458.1 murein DD-endopeptidase MepM/ murein hydrolase activator NlpD [Microbacter margulisiae]
MKKVIFFSFIWLFSYGFAPHAFAKKRVHVRHHYSHPRQLAAVDDVQRQINALNALMLQKMQQEEDPNATEDDSNIPASGIYESWTNSRINPYHMPVSKLPDSVKIDVSQFVPPVQSWITSHFGWRSRFHRMHYGTDLKLNIGDPVRCAFDGRVRITGYEPGGYGNYVVVRHDNGLETIYGHLSKILVRENEYLKAGDVLGLGGSTGRSTGPHLHFEVRYLGNAINPEKIFDFADGTPWHDTYEITKRGSFDYEYAHLTPSSNFRKSLARAHKAKRRYHRR